MFCRTTIIAAATTHAGRGGLADPIEGNWRTQSGETAAIGDCGGGFCITLKTGKHKGKWIGKVIAERRRQYSGSITEPATDKTYSGKARCPAASSDMKGCVLGGLICESQTWTKL